MVARVQYLQWQDFFSATMSQSGPQPIKPPSESFCPKRQSSWSMNLCTGPGLRIWRPLPPSTQHNMVLRNTILSLPFINQCSTILKFFLGLYVWVPSFKQTQHTFSLLLYLDWSTLYPMDTWMEVTWTLPTSYCLPDTLIMVSLPARACSSFLLSKKIKGLSSSN